MMVTLIFIAFNSTFEEDHQHKIDMLQHLICCVILDDSAKVIRNQIYKHMATTLGILTSKDTFLMLSVLWKFKW